MHSHPAVVKVTARPMVLYLATATIVQYTPMYCLRSQGTWSVLICRAPEAGCLCACPAHCSRRTHLRAPRIGSNALPTAKVDNTQVQCFVACAGRKGLSMQASVFRCKAHTFVTIQYIQLFPIYLLPSVVPRLGSMAHGTFPDKDMCAPYLWERRRRPGHLRSLPTKSCPPVSLTSLSGMDFLSSETRTSL